MTDALTLLNKNAFPIAQKTIAAASISSTYAIVGSGFTTPMLMVVIISTLDEAVQFSWDGVTDAFPILAGSAIVLDFKSDNIPLPAGYAPYVKEIGNPTTGSLYIGGFTSAG
jgi:hypothetical protein